MHNRYLNMKVFYKISGRSFIGMEPGILPVLTVISGQQIIQRLKVLGTNLTYYDSVYVQSFHAAGILNAAEILNRKHIKYHMHRIFLACKDSSIAIDANVYDAMF
jgi:hypothetical protein